jgi:ribosome-associated protein
MTVTDIPQVDGTLENALVVTRIADDFKGANTLLLDMRGVTPIVDYFVITTATSNRQMKAMAEESSRVMKKRGSRKVGWEGEESNSVWLLHDYGDIVLHIFTEEGRELYDLEGLWADAQRVDWQSMRESVGSI